MRKSRKETAETRELILNTAAREYRQNGIAETGLAEVMNAAGLTHGGFYRHFESKEDLVSQSLQRTFDQLFEGMDASGVGKTANDALAAIVNHYLSPGQRDHFERACPLAALGSELRRADDSTRDVVSSGVGQFVSILRKRIDRLPPRQAKAKATAMVSALVGGMVLARLVNDRTVSNSILKDTRDFILQA
jgi:TetR/AcrR family transcriptional regulator, transcriptional repressor for nem operon